MTPCVWCDQPREGHGVRYTAMVGGHEWTAPQPGAQHVPIPHPLGGITYRVDPSRLHQWIEDTDPAPVAEPPQVINLMGADLPDGVTVSRTVTISSDPVPGGGDRLPNSSYNRKASS